MSDQNGAARNPQQELVITVDALPQTIVIRIERRNGNRASPITGADAAHPVSESISTSTAPSVEAKADSSRQSETPPSNSAGSGSALRNVRHRSRTTSGLSDQPRSGAKAKGR